VADAVLSSGRRTPGLKLSPKPSKDDRSQPLVTELQRQPFWQFHWKVDPNTSLISFG